MSIAPWWCGIIIRAKSRSGLPVKGTSMSACMRATPSAIIFSNPSAPALWACPWCAAPASASMAVKLNEKDAIGGRMPAPSVEGQQRSRVAIVAPLAAQYAARRLHKVELIESCTKLSDSRTVEVADTGGLLRALARRPDGRAAWPEYEGALRGRSDAAAEVHCRSRAGEHDLIEKRVLCAYHEAGHAVVAVVLGMRLERVTTGREADVGRYAPRSRPACARSWPTPRCTSAAGLTKGGWRPSSGCGGHLQALLCALDSRVGTQRP